MDERIHSASLIVPKVVDIKNYQIVLQALTFEHEKVEVRKILENELEC